MSIMTSDSLSLPCLMFRAFSLRLTWKEMLWASSGKASGYRTNKRVALLFMGKVTPFGFIWYSKRPKSLLEKGQKRKAQQQDVEEVEEGAKGSSEEAKKVEGPQEPAEETDSDSDDSSDDEK